METYITTTKAARLMACVELDAVNKLKARAGGDWAFYNAPGSTIRRRQDRPGTPGHRGSAILVCAEDVKRWVERARVPEKPVAPLPVETPLVRQYQERGYYKTARHLQSLGG